MIRKIAVFLAATVLSATPALSQDSAVPAAPATVAPAAVPAKPKLICQNIIPTGSRLGGKKICMTAQEWREQQFENQKWLDGAARVHQLPGG